MATHFSTLSLDGTKGTTQGNGAKYSNAGLWESAQQGIHQAGDVSILEIYEDSVLQVDNVAIVVQRRPTMIKALRGDQRDG